jgi:hypothetical protein
VAVGSGFDLVNVRIKSMCTGSSVPLNSRPIFSSMSEVPLARTIVLNNGGVDEYRVKIIPTDSSATYSEELVVANRSLILPKSSFDDESYETDLSSTLQLDESKAISI